MRFGGSIPKSSTITADMADDFTPERIRAVLDLAPVRLNGSRAKMLGFVALSLMFVALSEARGREGAQGSVTALAAEVAFGVFALLGWVRAVWPPRLLLDASGLAVRGLFSEKRYSWSAMELPGLTIVTVGGIRSTAYVSFYSTEGAGKLVNLPTGWILSTEQLRDLLRAARRRWGTGLSEDAEPYPDGAPEYLAL